MVKTGADGHMIVHRYQYIMNIPFGSERTVFPAWIKKKAKDFGFVENPIVDLRNIHHDTSSVSYFITTPQIFSRQL